MAESSELVQSNPILDLFQNMQEINSQSVVPTPIELEFPKNGELRNNEMCFYKVKQLSYDEDYPHREAFENVLLSLDNDAFNFVYVLTGTEDGVELCLGVVENQNENIPELGKKLSAANYGEIVSNVFEGNFNGSKLERVKSGELQKLVGAGLKDVYQNAGVIVGVPSINEDDSGDKNDYQGIDRLINSMLGLEWRLIVICEPVSKAEIAQVRDSVYELYNRIAVYSKATFQQSYNDGSSISMGENESESKGENWGYSKSKSRSVSIDDDYSKSFSTQNSQGHDKSSSKGINKGFSINRGKSNSVTLEVANKRAEELMQYINDDLLERLKLGFSKGLFKTSIYYMAKEPTHANRLKVGLMSLFQGNQSSYSPLYAQKMDVSQINVFNTLRTYQSQYIKNEALSGDALMLLGRPCYEAYVGLSTYLTTEEISLIAGLPQKEVPGISLVEGVDFGLNQKTIGEDNAINLGNMVQKGRELVKNPFLLSRDSLMKHTFIAGVTGSGKTTTCHRLLSEADMPFLVIEPAKTEYRTLIQQDKDIVVFSVGNETVAPFRINPFELIPGEIISAHIDMLKATFTSAFPMEASMPQILEEAMYACYKEKEWNIDTNEYEGEDEDCFPILSQLLEKMKTIVESKHFSAQMQSDYIGSLVSRLSNLTVGSKGNMLNCQHSTNFNYIAHHNVILEMEELKSPEDKALLMGLILSRLSAVIKEEHRKNHDYRHLTLVEEAHRLLSKVEYGDSGSKKGAVETFTDLLAEVRKYGEGLIIIDQIPNKLSPEVLKNTNTKIIHKILAKDDKEVVGDTMLMDDKQKEYLSALEVGNAIIFTENTPKPVHIQIKAISNTNEKQIENQIVKQRFEERKEQLGACYEYQEITEIYSLFCEVAMKLSNMEESEKKEELIEKIDSVAAQIGLESKDVWRRLIMQRDILIGKEEDSRKKRVDALVEFMVNSYSTGQYELANIPIEIFGKLRK